MALQMKLSRAGYQVCNREFDIIGSLGDHKPDAVGYIRVRLCCICMRSIVRSL